MHLVGFIIRTIGTSDNLIKLIDFFFLQVKPCSTKGEKIDLSSFKDKFRLAAGQYTGTVTLQCNSGTSCFKFDGEFKRGK